MKKALHSAAVVLLAFTLGNMVTAARAQTTAFSYQGRLNVSGAPASGSYDLRFALCDAVTNGNVIGAVTNTATGVSNGLFAATLDFGGVFSGTNYWLEIAARTNGGGAFSTLSPRQPITPTPYAIYSASAGSATTATTAGIANSVSAANIVGTVQLVQLPGTVLTNGSSGVNLAGTFTGNGAGVTNVNLLSLNSGGAIGYVTNLNYSTNFYVTNIVTITTNSLAATNLSGKFVLAATLTNLGSATWLATMDVNNDGKLDLLVASTSSSAVIILTNNGAGVFGLYATVTNPNLISPNSILLADMNGDNRPDLICVNGLSPFGVVVFTNNGNGNFGYSADVGTYGAYPRVVAAGDFNGDNRIDLVADDTQNNYTGASGLTVITNSASGALSQSLNLPAGDIPYCVTAADINGDGKADIIAGNYLSDQGALTIYTNTGNGQFVLQSTNFPGISSATYVVATSIHANTNLDLVVADAANGDLFILTNNGSGVFGPNATLAVGANPYYVLATDVNGDGKPDLISANYGSGTLTVWTNNGSGTFGYNNTYTVGSQPLCLAAANMNGDGQQFLFCANSGSGTVSVFTNTSVGLTNFVTYTTNSAPMTNSVVTPTGTTNLNFNGSFSGNGGGLTNLTVTQLPGMVLTNNQNGVNLTGAFTGNGSGLTNLTGYVAKVGDTMTGSLSLPANGLVAGGSQLVLTNGDVGIGTTSPEYPLHVIGTGFFSSGLNTPGNGTFGGEVTTTQPGVTTHHFGTDAYGAYLNVDGAWPIRFEIATAEKMRIDSTGNVGIGTTSPTSKLYVNQGSIYVAPNAGTFLTAGDGNTTAYFSLQSALGVRLESNLGLFFAASGSERMRVDASGNVGIGTTNPAAMLDVNGSATVRGTINAVGGLVIQNLTADPTNPAPGQIWLRTDLP